LIYTGYSYWQFGKVADQMLAAMRTRLNDLGSILRLTLGRAIPLGISLSIKTERDITSKLFKLIFIGFYFLYYP